MTDKLNIRWMTGRDMEWAAALERASFEFPWAAVDFVRFLRGRSSIGMVAERGDHLCGYMVYELEKTQIVLATLAVDPYWRRCGVGRAMIERLQNKLNAKRRQRLVAVVTESNVRAQLWLRALGFCCRWIIRQPYCETDEDGYEFVYDARNLTPTGASDDMHRNGRT